MPVETRPGNKTPRPSVIEKKPRRKGRDGKTVRELDLEEKQRKKDLRAMKIQDLKGLEDEQVANLVGTAATPLQPTKMLRGGKQVGPATAVKKTRKRAATSKKQPQGRGGHSEGDDGKGALDVDGCGTRVDVSLLFAEARRGPLLGHSTLANLEPIAARPSSSSTNLNKSIALGKKRERTVPDIQEAEVSLDVSPRHKNTLTLRYRWRQLMT